MVGEAVLVGAVEENKRSAAMASRVQQGGSATPRVADDHGRVEAERVDHGCHVSGELFVRTIPWWRLAVIPLAVRDESSRRRQVRVRSVPRAQAVTQAMQRDNRNTRSTAVGHRKPLAVDSECTDFHPPVSTRETEGVHAGSRVRSRTGSALGLRR